jgi:hypothetical protein
VTILEALHDPALFGSLPPFRAAETWNSWRAFLAAVYGLPMSEADLETFRAHTGVCTPRAGGYAEAVAVTGRQSGKTRIAATLAVYEAITATAEGGTELSALLVAQDHRAALRTLLKYAAAPFDLAPMLSREVVTRTADTIALSKAWRSSRIRVDPPRSVGYGLGSSWSTRLRSSRRRTGVRRMSKCFARYVPAWRRRAGS